MFAKHSSSETYIFFWFVEKREKKSQEAISSINGFQVGESRGEKTKCWVTNRFM
mgnify:FL=1